jgi:hypothetical protein
MEAMKLTDFYKHKFGFADVGWVPSPLVPPKNYLMTGPTHTF